MVIRKSLQLFSVLSSATLTSVPTTNSTQLLRVATNAPLVTLSSVIVHDLTELLLSVQDFISPPVAAASISTGSRISAIAGLATAATSFTRERCPATLLSSSYLFKKIILLSDSMKKNHLKSVLHLTQLACGAWPPVNSSAHLTDQILLW